MEEERYTKHCKDCPNWKDLCWVKKPGEVDPRKCDIYTAYHNHVTSNWNALGVTNK